MRFFCFILTLLLLPTSSRAVDPYKCKDSKDCVKAYHGCGRYESVNRKYKKRVEELKRKEDRKHFCNKPSKEEVDFYYQAESTCEKKVCKLVEPKAKSESKSETKPAS